jgi:DNA transformation protein and related proteins
MILSVPHSTIDNMATQKETEDFVIEKLGESRTFMVRAMFGEYALYCNEKVVALICDDTLYVKILPPSAELETECEQGPPYPGAKPHYIVTEDMLGDSGRIAEILMAISKTLPAKKQKKKKLKNSADANI